MTTGQNDGVTEVTHANDAIGTAIVKVLFEFIGRIRGLVFEAVDLL